MLYYFSCDCCCGILKKCYSVTFTHVVKHTITQVMVFYPYEKPDFDFEDDEPTNSPPSTGLLSKDAGDLPPILLG